MKRIWIALGAAALAAATLSGLVVTGLVGLPTAGKLPFAIAIGGPFELTSQLGRRFGSKDLAGKPFVIFFGYTHCPDVCPTTLLDMSNHLARLGPDAAKLNIVFVTIDPERDTPAKLKAYLSSFDQRIVGLVGTMAETRSLARAYRITYRKVPAGDSYTMDHTASAYLMDRTGAFTGTLSFEEPDQAQFKKLARLLAG